MLRFFYVEFKKKMVLFLITVIQSGIYFIIILIFKRHIFCRFFFGLVRLQTEPDKIFDVHFVMWL